MKNNFFIHWFTPVIALVCLTQSVVTNDWCLNKEAGKNIQVETEDKGTEKEEGKQAYFYCLSQSIQPITISFFNSLQQIDSVTFPKLIKSIAGKIFSNSLPVSKLLEVVFESTAAPNAP